MLSSALVMKQKGEEKREEESETCQRLGGGQQLRGLLMHCRDLRNHPPFLFNKSRGAEGLFLFCFVFFLTKKPTSDIIMIIDARGAE